MIGGTYLGKKQSVEVQGKHAGYLPSPIFQLEIALARSYSDVNQSLTKPESAVHELEGFIMQYNLWLDIGKVILIFLFVVV